MPISTANAQNSSCSVCVFIRPWPKLIANTMASGEKATMKPRPLVRPVGPISAFTAPLVANSRATMPVSSTPEAM